MEPQRVALAFTALLLAFTAAFAAGRLAGDSSSAARAERAAPIQVRAADLGAAVRVGGALPVLRLGATATATRDRGQAPIAPNPQPSQPPLLASPAPAPAQPAPRQPSPPKQQPEPVFEGGGGID